MARVSHAVSLKPPLVMENHSAQCRGAEARPCTHQVLVDFLLDTPRLVGHRIDEEMVVLQSLHVVATVAKHAPHGILQIFVICFDLLNLIDKPAVGMRVGIIMGG
jgi:hypothetical protein